MARITIKELAKETGFSCATISRALKNHPRISAVTIAKVQEAAKRLGYQADARVSDLMFYLRKNRDIRGRPVLAMIVQENPPHVFYRKFEEQNAGVINGAVVRAREQGYEIEPHFVTPGEDVEQSLSRVLWNRGIKGVLVAPLENPALPFALDWNRFSAVSIGHSLVRPRLNRAVSNQYQTFTECIHQLIKLGYKRIGTVLADSESVDLRTDSIYRGAHAAMAYRHRQHMIAKALELKRNDWPAFWRWFKRYTPDALLLVSVLPEWIQPCLLEAGYRCPEDIGLATVHLRTLDGSVSGVNQNSIAVGSAAVDILINMIRTNQVGVPQFAHSLMIDGSWVDGMTTQFQLD